MDLGVETIRSFSDAIDRSMQFTRAAILMGKLDAKKVGNQWLIPSEEVEKFLKKPFKISRKELAGVEN